ncbi:GTPase HflX [Pseudobacteriovorax antillogorgiicola]|uniref:GTPase HflX n=1 Tax=Pseudobacteriovorax antillogorgiicola TaxID=1513793 RepID=A0A1Y6C251_9BACT|nr:GTPase HflX [Pseudobacteriovorax antillogorgiicola]TCS50231.1 GTP-binding protein HflX [Pseudobacteriovorax antillogorgiicola]SMF32687.1 GTP-binding protein HflX [Pseudobacteriovorax antillogorgiicola]
MEESTIQEVVSSQSEPAGAILVGILLSGESFEKLKEDLDELESLLDTLGVRVHGRIVQKRHRLTAKTLLGTGKVDEIKELAESYNADWVVFDRALSPPQVRNLEEMTCKSVMDRTGVILEIFSKHARTNQAKTQVEIARLEYLLPRLTGAWTHFQRQAGGGVRSRGMGEKQIEIDRRRARERIAKLQKQLDQIRKEKQTQRKARSQELKVAIVGYTNSGKTTLMKSLTRATVAGKNELFATLDTNIKAIDPRTRPKILLSDTVGFIRNLPHSLVESFKSTLDEVREADLLLHVVDVSYHSYEDHIRITRQVLEEIGAGDVPQLMVFNKSDLLDDPILPRVLKAAYPGSQTLSANSPEEVNQLRDHIYGFFRKNLVSYSVAIDISEQTALSKVYNNCLILKTDYDETGKMVFYVQSTRATMAKLRKYIVELEDDESSEEKSMEPDYVTD